MCVITAIVIRSSITDHMQSIYRWCVVLQSGERDGEESCHQGADRSGAVGDGLRVLSLDVRRTARTVDHPCADLSQETDGHGAMSGRMTSASLFMASGLNISSSRS